MSERVRWLGAAGAVDGDGWPCGAGALAASAFAADGGERHVVVAGVGEAKDDVAARCSLWWRATPRLHGERTGYIGHFHAHGAEAAARVLNAACEELRGEGCAVAVGPIDGSTWRKYRLVTERGGEPPFFMEPDTPEEWVGWWANAEGQGAKCGAGFVPLASYCSSLNPALTRDDGALEATARRPREAGIRLRQIDRSRFDQELRRIYDLSISAFADNFLYSPIMWEEFAAMYAPLRERLIPEFVVLADDPDDPSRLAGFLIGVPDLLELKRGLPMLGTVLLKTLAVAPERRSVGLGGWLIAHVQHAAARMGFTRSIFALMHDENHSVRIGDRYGAIMRRYTLFTKRMAP